MKDKACLHDVKPSSSERCFHNRRGNKNCLRSTIWYLYACITFCTMYTQSQSECPVSPALRHARTEWLQKASHKCQELDGKMEGVQHPELKNIVKAIRHQVSMQHVPSFMLLPLTSASTTTTHRLAALVIVRLSKVVAGRAAWVEGQP